MLKHYTSSFVFKKYKNNNNVIYKNKNYIINKYSEQIYIRNA